MLASHLLAHAFRGVDGELLPAEEVPQRDVKAFQVAPVVGVRMADDNSVQLFQRYVELKVGEGARACLQPGAMASGPHQVAATGPTRTGVAAVRTEHGQGEPAGRLLNHEGRAYSRARLRNTVRAGRALSLRRCHRSKRPQTGTSTHRQARE